MCMTDHNNNNSVHTIIIIRALIQWELFCARHKPCMSCSINSCRGSMRVGTVVRPTLSMKKLRHREGKSFLKVTQPVRVRLVCEPRSLFSVQFSRSVVSDSLRPHELQHSRPPCSSPSPGVHSDSCPSSQWYHPAISSSVVPFSSCPQSLQHQSFSMSQLFAWSGPSLGVSALLPCK